MQLRFKRAFLKVYLANASQNFTELLTLTPRTMTRNGSRLLVSNFNPLLYTIENWTADSGVSAIRMYLNFNYCSPFNARKHMFENFDKIATWFYLRYAFWLAVVGGSWTFYRIARYFFPYLHSAKAGSVQIGQEIYDFSPRRCISCPD